jgi:hypothetical protein
MRPYPALFMSSNRSCHGSAIEPSMHVTRAERPRRRTRRSASDDVQGARGPVERFEIVNRSGYALVILVVLLAACTAVRSQTIRNVPAQYPSIQAAIVAASPGDTVRVAPGMYVENIDFLGKHIVVASAQGAAVTTIDGGQEGPVVRFAANEGRAAVLAGFTITNGRGAGYPAGPYTTSVAEAGGVDARPFCSPTILRCEIVGNQGGDGYPAAPGSSATSGGPGGVLAWDALLVDCRIANNLGGRGGNGMPGFVTGSGGAGGCTVGGQAISWLIRCRVEGNIGGDEGLPGSATSQAGVGGCAISGRIHDSLFLGNTGGNGSTGGTGGVSLSHASEMHDSLVAANTGGMAQAGSPSGVPGSGGVQGSFVMHVSHCTVTANIGGLPVAASGSSLASAGISNTGFPGSRIESSIVWGNALPDGTPSEIGQQNVGGASPLLAVAFSDVRGGFTGTANFDSDPLFVAPGVGDWSLSQGSPCIDTAPAEIFALNVRPHDAAGHPRWLGASPDAGCFEYGSFDPSLLGSNEDIALASRVPGQGSPYATTKLVQTGAHFGFMAFSPSGTTAFRYPVFVAEAFFGAAPAQSTVFPDVHFSGNAFIVLDGSLTGQNLQALPYVETWIPAGLSGLTLRLQVVAWEPLAKNGFFVASDAHDVVFN